MIWMSSSKNSQESSKKNIFLSNSYNQIHFVFFFSFIYITKNSFIVVRRTMNDIQGTKHTPIEPVNQCALCIFSMPSYFSIWKTFIRCYFSDNFHSNTFNETGFACPVPRCYVYMYSQEQVCRIYGMLCQCDYERTRSKTLARDHHIAIKHISGFVKMKWSAHIFWR